MLTSVGLAFLVLFGRAMSGSRVGFWSAIILLATPANAALSTFFTIDPPLFASWAASIFAWRWWVNPGSPRALSLALIISLGCGYLTKQIQLVFPLVLMAFAAVHRRQLRSGDGWRLLGMVAASLFLLTPPLWWNWRHGWITFRHTADKPKDGLGNSSGV